MSPTLRYAAVLLALGLSFYSGVRGQTEGSGMLMPYTTEEPSLEPDGSGITPPLEGSGGSGGGLEPDRIVCSNSINELTVSLFDSISSALTRFDCHFVMGEGNSTGLLFLFEYPDGQELIMTEDIRDMLFFDQFRTGSIKFVVTVCTYDGIEECDGAMLLELGNVTLNIVSHRDRLFPFGDANRDMSFRDVLDGAVPILAPQTFPFYSTYYHTLYVSSNGLVSLNQPYLSWWPVPFPYGRTPTSVIAPYWTDLDFRNRNRERSKVYYHTYAVGDGSLRSEELLRLFADRLDSYADGEVGFEPAWMAVITWNEATPYHWRFYTEQTVTFQLVFATDYISTYAFYLYPSGGFDAQLPSWRRVVIGHDPKDYKNYNNVALPSGTRYNVVDRLPGNTGELGQWYFNFTSSSSEANSERLCLEWDKEQRSSNRSSESFFRGLPSCPCTRNQARRDWRFWFAHFWGLSSRPNCATFLWSGRQATIECCYDDTDGSLLVGPNAGGSSLLYNPLFRFRDYFLSDRKPYQQCCESSDRCDLFYRHRPSNNCSNYNPPRRFFIFGDPHFKSIDNRNFTFNGIGEYQLLESQANSLSIQARLEQFDANTAGTVTTSVLVQESSLPPVQVNAESGSFVLYVNGNQTDLPGTGSAIVAGSNGVMDVNDVSTVGLGVSTEEVFVRRESNNGVDTLVITTPQGASLSVTIENSFLGIAVELSESFRDETRGLLGVFNGDGGDDFTLRNGTVLDITAEEDIYQFGLDWHISEADSLFSYGGDQTYSSLNADYLDFVPTFFDELNITQEVINVCGDNQACLLDASITGNVNIGNSTLQDEIENEDLEAVLDNTPPTITGGEFFLRVNTGESVSVTYTAEDPDGDNIASIMLQGIDMTGIVMELKSLGSIGMLQMTWDFPGYDIPSKEIKLSVSDTKGAVTSRRISIVLCGCTNNGSCSSNTPLLNAQGHSKLQCTCPLFFGGDSCEIDMRGCGFDVCPDYAVCVNDSTVASGYTCSNCTEGYQIIPGGDEKCVDINECDSISSNNCSQLCVNDEGSYSCECEAGYRLSTDGFSCQDVDECLEGTDDCAHICSNINGSYICSCYSGHILNSDTNECELVNCSMSPCATGTDCVDLTAGQFQCVCPLGQRCSGMCSGALDAVSSSAQTCKNCAGNSYGFDCMETCNCMNGGVCDRVSGCMCTQGMWSGKDCSIEVNDYDPVFDENSVTLTSPIRWDFPSNSLVATVIANDDDTNPNSGSVAYRLVKPQYQLSPEISDGLAFFEINERTGEIRNQEDLGVVYTQYAFTSFVLTVSARDRGANARSSQTTIAVVPLPVPMLPDSIGTITVSENTAIGTSVFDRFNCTELGPSSGSLTLTLTNSLSTPFTIEPDTSSLAVSRIIDYEALSNSLFDLEVVCTNRHQITDTLDFQVVIQNLDDNPFEFDMPTYSVEISENTTAATAVLTVHASDLDSPNNAVRYSFVNNTFPELILLPTTGVVMTTVDLDRETHDVYYLEVRANLVDPGINSVSSVTANVTITLTDVNDNSPYFIPSDVYIEEVFSDSRIGNLVLTVLAMDDDIGSNGKVRYELEENEYLEINETTGEVLVKELLSPSALLALGVIATDNGAIRRSTSGRVIIYVRPSPEKLQFGRNRYIFNVTENDSRGVQLGSVGAVILDVLNSTFNESSEHSVEYEIVNGTTQPFFLISRQTGDIFLLTSLDYESAREYDFVVRAVLSSDADITREVPVQVLVENLNDNAPQFSASFYTSVVEELTPAGTSILAVSALDLDEIASANISFRLDGVTNRDPFEIDSVTGVLSAAQLLVNIRDYRFSVVASDGELESEVVVFVSVTRSSSVSPTFTRETYIFNISENTMPGSHVGTVVVLTNGSMSSEEYSHLGFRILSPDTNESLFHIDENSGDISTIALSGFDAESQRLLVFYVEAFDVNLDTVHDTAVIEIHLTDVNDNRPTFRQSLYTRVINTSQPINSVILTVTAEDVDAINNNVEYAIATGPLGFAVGVTSGELSVTNSTIVAGQYYLTVVATDGGTPAMNGTATIYVAILPDTPERVEFNQSVYRFEVTENAEFGLLVGMVKALDSMNSVVEDLIYSTPNVTRCFTLGESDGEIRVSCQLDREAVSRYELELVASLTDGENTVRGYSTVVIDIIDVNDNQPVFSLDVYAAVIDDTYGNNTILQVFATDRDVGENAAIQYTIKDPPGSLNQATPFFTIDPSAGNISLAQVDVPIGDYRLIAFATDGGSPVQMSSTAVVLICITRSQPAQIVFRITGFQVAENMPPGTPVGTVSLSSGIQTIDPSEFPNNLQFSITNGGNLFTIDPINGEVTTVEELDREEASSRVITVEANFMSFGIRASTSIAVLVEDLNDERPVFMPSSYAETIEDNTGMNGFVLGVEAIDYDLGENSKVSFSIVENIGLPFDVRPESFVQPRTRGSVIVSNTSLLIPGTYEFTLVAMDNGTPQLNATATVTIIVIHALPDEIFFPTQPYIFNFTENTLIDSFVGNVSVVQETPALVGLVYEIVGGNNGFFSMEPFTGTLTNVRLINREANSSYSLTIRAHLPGETRLSSTETTVIVNILDVNDNVPLFSNGGTYTVNVFADEVTLVSSLITVEATDADEGTNAAIQFSITAGNERELFRIDQLSGAIFASVAPLNVSTHILTVTVSDMGESPLSSDVSVTIVIQNAVPQSINFLQPDGYIFTTNENTDFTLNIGQVSVETIQPEDLEQYLSYTVVPDSFIIHMDGSIRSAGTLDYETAHNHTLTVTATLAVPLERYTPELTLTTDVQVIIFVNDLNDNIPVFVDFPHDVELLEERSSEVLAATVSATDADSGNNQRLTYILLNTDASVTDQFRLDSENGQLFAASGIDREVQEMYTLLIRVCDMGVDPRQNCINGEITFTLLDINDNSPRLTSGSIYEVRERLPAGTAVFTIAATDPDTGPFGTSGLRYILYNVVGSSGTNYGGASVFRENERTGEVTLLQELDFESETFYTADLRIRDNWFDRIGNANNRIDVGITINVVNEPDNTPQFSSLSYQATTYPVLARDYTVIDVVATDEDINDRLTFEIVSILEEGNGGVPPMFAIDSTSGRVYLSEDQVFVPEARFTLSLKVYDNSQFNLSADATLVVDVRPETLQFEQATYSVEISEGVSVGSELTRLSIRELSVSSGISYILDVISPLNQASRFSLTRNGASATVSLGSGMGLDREDVDEYTMMVTAQRTDPDETATAALVITVLDVNDNNPLFIDGVDPVIAVEEELAAQTTIAKINATDRDIDENGRIRYSILDAPRGFPFTINEDSGFLTVIGDIDYEEVQNFTMTVLARDSASPALSSTQTYILQVININDHFPQFTSTAYFGEVFVGAQAGDIVHHIELTVVDPDDVYNEQQLSFTILDDLSDSEDSNFEVSNEPPYRIKVVSLSDVSFTAPTVLSLRVSVADSDFSSTAPLFISVFVRTNLITFNLNGVGINKEELESCTNTLTSLCEFLRILGEVVTNDMSSTEGVFFSNHSLVNTGPETAKLEVYGWYGSEYNIARKSDGELANRNPPSVVYLEYSSELFTTTVDDNQFQSFQFGLQIIEEMTEPPPMTTTPEPEPESNNMLIIIIAIVCGVALAALCIILVIVIICVRHRRKDNTTRRKRPRRSSDPYLRPRTDPRQRRFASKSKRSSNEGFPLTPGGGSDLAYETMYDDDEILDSNQTMPWFDPKYLATDEQYDGDTERTQRGAPPVSRGGPVRATVDGNARRQRRRSSDDSAAPDSATEMENYLDQYQQSTPMRPGQRMGEFDMFAQPPDSDLPFRPSLDQYQWNRK